MEQRKDTVGTNHLETVSMFVRLISHQPALLLSQNKPATNNQPAVLFSQNKSAPAISHQPNEQAGWSDKLKSSRGRAEE
jgi:hypothetical protein